MCHDVARYVDVFGLSVECFHGLVFTKLRNVTPRQVVIDKTDPATKGGDNPAALCAAFGEGLGLIKSFRIVVDECLDEGDERTKTLAGLDRSIRQLQSQVDKNCE